MDLNQKVGIIGGGQLGKMMILEAKRMGIYVVVLDPTEHCPAHSIADEHIVADFHSEEAIRSLAEKTDVITYEFEHIGVEVLERLENEGYKIYPTAKSLSIIQRKDLQKKLLKENKIPVPDFMLIDKVGDIFMLGEKYTYPMMLKACTGGYDGKGNAFIENKEGAEAAFYGLGSGKLPLMAEEFIDYKMEISVLACRGIDGEISVYPVGENIHVDSVLEETIVPARISEEVAKRAMELAHRVMMVFEGVGMFCVEMFLTEKEELYINEVAPRPHNSGHYTIEGCYTNQFEQHIRAIMGIPFGNTQLRCPTVMRNLLGREGQNGKPEYIGVEDALKLSNIKVHLYGKEEVKPGRKMGHVAAVGETIEKARKDAYQAQQMIQIVVK